MSKGQTIPRVFISSTSEDLKPYREAAQEAVLRAGCLPVMFEYWESKPNPALPECLQRVRETDVLVAIVAHRFGWVPEDQPERNFSLCKSITWLECEEARKKGLDVLGFLVDEKANWPDELKEEYRILQPMQKGAATPDLLADIQSRMKRLSEFKAELSRNSRNTFDSPPRLGWVVESSLREWMKKQGFEGAPSLGKRRESNDYLRFLHSTVSHIELRGLKIESGKAQRFEIGRLYVPLSASAGMRREQREDREKSATPQEMDAPGPVELQRALTEHAIVIAGDPGTGKTTFVRWVICGLCGTRLGLEGKPSAADVGFPDAPFPFLISVEKLLEHIRKTPADSAGVPRTACSHEWIVNYLATPNDETGPGLDSEFTVRTFEQGAMLLMDGLDQAPDEPQRRQAADILTAVARRYPETRFVVTSRLPAIEGEPILPEFLVARIEPLSDDAVRLFIRQWSACLYSDDERKAVEHEAELRSALWAKPGIRRMARNALMLTALAVVHWHQRPLPEQRAELYQAVINWLARSREKRSGRVLADECVRKLQELALAMRRNEEGFKVQVPRRWAAEQIEAEFPEGTKPKRIAAAGNFLRDEELDSGIVVGRGNEIRFWHQSFQEFLAARAIAARMENEQRKMLNESRLYAREWREVVLLYAGILYGQGRFKIDAFVEWVLDRLSSNADLARKARCAGLLGSVARDLAPLGYKLENPRYTTILSEVEAVFDAKQAERLEIRDIIGAAEALAEAGDPRFDAWSFERNLVAIPAGEFRMGSQKDKPKEPNCDEEASEDEMPACVVSLDAFRIGKYPVTVMEYERFVDDGGYRDADIWKTCGFWRWQMPGDWDGQLEHLNWPVTGVSWYDAMAYCQWLSRRTGLSVRLPSEAEWERASRGVEGRKYPWGATAPNPRLANFHESKIEHPTPVGIYPKGATPDGVMDMAGNVCEWTRNLWGQDFKEPKFRYPYKADDGREDLLVGYTFRVLRGGMFKSNSGRVRCADRDKGSPYIRLSFIGFRVVVAPGFSEL